MAHLLEWPESRTLTIPSTGKGVEQQELSFIAGGNAEWYSCLGRQLGISYKKPTTLSPYNPEIMPIMYLPKWIENLFPYKKPPPHILFIEALLIIAKTRINQSVLQAVNG